MLHRITSQFKKETCPYCFDYFHIKDTPFRCSSVSKHCPPVSDPIYTKNWGDTRPIGRVLAKKGKFSDRFIDSIRCTDCNNDSYKRLCPNCHMELPHTTGKYKNHIFAVVGGKDSGKSHYIAVLIEQIKKRIGPNMNLLLTAENDFTVDRYNKDFYEPIFQKGKTIGTTVSATTDQKVQLPMVYSLRFTEDSLFEKNKIKEYMTLVFFDTAGEDLNSEDSISAVNKYIYRSDGIILLIDPLQLMPVRNRLPSDTPMPVKMSETGDILTRITRLIEKSNKLKPMEKIKIPLAIAFSKFDAVLPLVDSQFQLRASANHDNGFDYGDFEAINSEMMSLLDKWNGQDIIQLTKTRYEQYGFFGLSALGCNPHDSQQIDVVLPSRIEDPFLWLLANNGLIKKVKHS